MIYDKPENALVIVFETLDSGTKPLDQLAQPADLLVEGVAICTV
jgi:hypothetical protein